MSQNIDETFGHAVNFYLSGKLEKAKKNCHEILKKHPRHCEANSLLASIYQKLEQFELAIKYAQQAVEAQSDYVQGWYNLGYIYNKQERFEEANKAYLKVLEFTPEHAEAWYCLGNTFRGLAKDKDAIKAYKKAISLNPNLAKAYHNLGRAYNFQQRQEEAIDIFHKAISIQPGFAKVYSSLAKALADQGQQKEAMETHQKAIELDPEDPFGYQSLAETQKIFGDINLAEASYRQAIKINPDEATGAFAALTSIYKYKVHDEISLNMLSLYKKRRLPPKDQTILAFGLSRLFEGLGDFDKAFDYLSEANQLKRASFTYTTEETRQEFEKIKTTFKHIRRHRGKISIDMAPPQPLFILGMPRSATTLTEQILASHPAVTGAGELVYLSRAVQYHLNSSKTQTNQSLDSPNDQQLLAIAQSYLKNLKKHHEDGQFITDKMPENFRHIGLIKTLWPQAKIIHCIRNPVDNCLAIYRQDFTGIHKHAYHLEELARYYLLYQNLMDFWHEQFPGEIHDIHYEELVSNQEDQTRQLLAFCDLPWDEGCLQFHKTERAVRTASMAQVRQPIYKDAQTLADRYADHLSPLREILGPNN